MAQCWQKAQSLVHTGNVGQVASRSRQCLNSFRDGGVLVHEVKNNVIQHPSREGVLKWPFLIWQLIRNIQNELAWIGRNAIACPGFTVAGFKILP